MSSLNFSSDKERLLNTLTRFDNTTISVGDVTDSGKSKIHARQYHTFFLHILLENVCFDIEPDEQKREILFTEVCKQLAESKFLNESLVLDNLLPLRRKLAQQFFNFVKQIHYKVIPDPSESSVTVDSFLENTDFSTKLELQYKYEQNFDELEVIAKGGFGVVCKARHKVTDIVYAVKKVLFKYKSDSEYLKVIREAKNIAALNHPNIVSYNNAWIECLPPCDFDTEDLDTKSSSEDSISSSEDSEADMTEEHLSRYSRVFETNTQIESVQSSIDVPERFIQRNFRQMNNVFTENHSNLSMASQQNRVTKVFNQVSEPRNIHKNNDCECGEAKSNSWVPSCLNVRVMLCIQMEYCNCDLRLWLDQRAGGAELPFDMDVMKIFRDILNGVAHIHSKNIIHRDLKPQNIFYSEGSNILKIGDFGLATLESCATDVKSGFASRKHSANLGTVPYAAPEQMKYKLYDSKVDIYSLGIILIEILNVFSTKMEFSKAIDEIHKGNFPAEMEKNWPMLINLVKSLVKKNPDDRMDAKEILSQLHALENTESNEIMRLKSALVEKEEEIIRLRAKVQEQQSIICKQNVELQQ